MIWQRCPKYLSSGPSSGEPFSEPDFSVANQKGVKPFAYPRNTYTEYSIVSALKLQQGPQSLDTVPRLLHLAGLTFETILTLTTTYSELHCIGYLIKLMLQQYPAVSSSLWNPSLSGVCLGFAECKTLQLSALRSCVKAKNEKIKPDRPTTSGTFSCVGQRPAQRFNSKKQEACPQNMDFPPVLPKKKKKPYPIPLKKMQLAAKADKKLAGMGLEKPLEPPKNGLLVPDLIPVAYEVLDAWKILIRGVAQLLHVVPFHACSECSEIHVARSGHDIQDCHGQTSAKRRGFHSWAKGSVNDVLIPIESYHMYDPFGLRIKHDTRFSYDRIPALVELCIQAGVDLPDYPSRRRTKPVRIIGKKVIDRGGLEEPGQHLSVDSTSSQLDLDTHRAFERFPAPAEQEVPRIAQETVLAYEQVKRGVTKLMRKYTVKACGYCPEVHVGPWGHNTKLCGEFKHQWRDGKHGWQDATVDEVFPPNHVWHVQDPSGPPLSGALKRFYGKAPAVIELCMQAGAQVPDHYKPMMRLDVVLPESEEAFLVA